MGVPIAEIFSGKILSELKTSGRTEEPLKALKRAKEAGIDTFDLRVIPEIDFLEERDLRNKLGLDDFFWKEIERGAIDKSAAKVSGGIFLVDRIQIPNYVSGGKQMYDSDLLGPMLAEMRDEKRIVVPTYYQKRVDKEVETGIDPMSRFTISADEVSQIVCPEIASRIEVELVRLLTVAESALLSNLYYLNLWRGNNISEWTADKYQGDKSLTIGSSVDKSGIIGYHKSDGHAPNIGFRVAAVFPLN